MEPRLKEILAALDLVIADQEINQPLGVREAVELNWQLRKLGIARGLLADVVKGQRSGGTARPFSSASRLRVE